MSFWVYYSYIVELIQNDCMRILSWMTSTPCSISQFPTTNTGPASLSHQSVTSVTGVGYYSSHTKVHSVYVYYSRDTGVCVFICMCIIILLYVFNSILFLFPCSYLDTCMFNSYSFVPSSDSSAISTSSKLSIELLIISPARTQPWLQLQVAMVPYRQSCVTEYHLSITRCNNPNSVYTCFKIIIDLS